MRHSQPNPLKIGEPQGTSGKTRGITNPPLNPILLRLLHTRSTHPHIPVQITRSVPHPCANQGPNLGPFFSFPKQQTDRESPTRKHSWFFGVCVFFHRFLCSCFQNKQKQQHMTCIFFVFFDSPGCFLQWTFWPPLCFVKRTFWDVKISTKSMVAAKSGGALTAEPLNSN